jgi:hypothetical protein
MRLHPGLRRSEMELKLKARFSRLTSILVGLRDKETPSFQIKKEGGGEPPAPFRSMKIV